MKKRFLFFLFVSLGLSQSGLSQMRENLKTEIDKIIYHDTEIAAKEIPGFVIGVIFRDSVFIFSYGSTSKETLIPPNEETIFETGGLTKVFTASLVNLLADEGLMHYDSSLNHYLLPEFRNEKANDITIRDLIIHASGLPKLPLEFGLKSQQTNNPYANYTKTDLLDFYSNYTPEAESRGKYYYSNLNYALLELAIEFATRQPFEVVLEEKIFRPLEMHNSSITVADSTQFAKGYTIAGLEAPIWQFQSFAASEGVKSTAGDLLKFLACNLGKTQPDLAASFSHNHIPHIKTELNKNAWAANGWHLVKRKKYYDLLMHGGATSGQRAFIGFVKETQTGVVLLSNSEYRTDGLGFLILRMLNNNWKK